MSLIQKEFLHYPKYKINFNLQDEYILKNEINNTIEIELLICDQQTFQYQFFFSKNKLKRIFVNHFFEIINKENDMKLPQSGWSLNKLIFLDDVFHKINILLRKIYFTKKIYIKIKIEKLFLIPN